MWLQRKMKNGGHSATRWGGDAGHPQRPHRTCLVLEQNGWGGGTQPRPPFPLGVTRLWEAAAGAGAGLRGGRRARRYLETRRAWPQVGRLPPGPAPPPTSVREVCRRALRAPLLPGQTPTNTTLRGLRTPPEAAHSVLQPQLPA